MLSTMRFRTVILALMVTVLASMAQPRAADAEVSGSLPAAGKGGIALVSYSGGTMDTFQAELFGQGCSVLSVWTTVSGRSVGYFPLAPDFVNQGFLDLYPVAELPAGSLFLVVCQEAEVSAPTTSASDPSAGLYVCGPQGNEAVIEVTFWDYYPRITEASSNQAFMEVKYRFPSGASDAGILSFIKTGVGWPSGQDIEGLFGVENPLDPSGLGLIAISAPFPRILQSPTAPDHIVAVADGNEHVISWDKLKTFTPGKAYFEAYVRGDLLHGERPDVSFNELASALGATDPYALEEPPVIVFAYTMPDGKVWGNTFEDLASCDYITQQ